MKNKLAMLAIDIQNDFTSPQGSLFVKGAEEDIERTVKFINNNREHIDYVALSLDSHQPIHIAHQCYWKDGRGNAPALFSEITALDVKEGRWIPQYNKDMALLYLEQLERKQQICTIWPTHCIAGGWGWTINQDLIDCLSDWAVLCGKSFELFYKGYTQTTEHYSIFRAAVEWEGHPETQLNIRLLDLLNSYDEVIVLGQAADFCVANSLNDILDESESLTSKLVLFTDCMSWINQDNQRAKLIFDRAKQRGVKFMKSVDY